MRRRNSLPIVTGFLVLCCAALAPMSRAGETARSVQDETVARLRGESILSHRLLLERLAALRRLAHFTESANPGHSSGASFQTHGIYDDPDPAGKSREEEKERRERFKMRKSSEENPRKPNQHRGQLGVPGLSSSKDAREDSTR